MLHVIDSSSSENTHVMFNVSMIKVLLKAYPDTNVTFYAEQLHQTKVIGLLNELENRRIRFIPVSAKRIVSNRIQKTLLGIRKTSSDVRLFRRILRECEKSDSDKVFICKAHPLSLLFMKYIKKLHASIPVMAAMHGELEFLYYANSQWERNVGATYRSVLKLSVPNFRYVLLNKISKKLLIEDGYLKAEEIIEIDHPYPYSESKSLSAGLSQEKKAITIGHIGSLGMRKNAHLIYSLAKFHTSEITNGLIKFVAIGPIEEDAKPYQNTLVTDFTSDDRTNYISRETFIAKIRETDYAIFFYSQNQFIFRASGSILDAIDFTKPIIALQHPFFDYLFDEVENIGFICADIAAMSDIISRIARRDPYLIGQYEEQCANLDKFKKRHSIELIAREFSQQSH